MSEWYAKPSGGYSISSPYGQANAISIAQYFAGQGFTKEASAAIIGNIMGESALNPWRWEGDQEPSSWANSSYGLFQYHGADTYLNNTQCRALDQYAPNLSPHGRTEGSEPYDGIAQLIAFRNNYLGKWQPYYTAWSTSHPAHAIWIQAINTYGDRGTITIEQFKRIPDIQMAVVVFLVAFERPTVLDGYTLRTSYAEQAYDVIHNVRFGIPIWLLMKIKEANDN